mmetsp:Transcript_30680/g.69174  ORF Transcript_30680/g.69174 Transcript_30680/m.69174 type:complete len:259 (+) Transcript_30680:731-1507(+)
MLRGIRWLHDELGSIASPFWLPCPPRCHCSTPNCFEPEIVRRLIKRRGSTLQKFKDMQAATAVCDDHAALICAQCANVCPPERTMQYLQWSTTWRKNLHSASDVFGNQQQAGGDGDAGGVAELSGRAAVATNRAHGRAHQGEHRNTMICHVRNPNLPRMHCQTSRVVEAAQVGALPTESVGQLATMIEDGNLVTSLVRDEKLPVRSDRNTARSAQTAPRWDLHGVFQRRAHRIGTAFQAVNCVAVMVKQLHICSTRNE